MRLISLFQTSLYSSNSRENLTDDKKTEAGDSNKKINLATPSTTPLEPNKNTWKSVETLAEKPINKQKKPIEKQSEELEDEFDMFTKERVEQTVKTPTEKIEAKIQRPTNIPLEPSILVLNVPKVNLKTVEEEKSEIKDIKNSDIKSIISETASSITQFCEDVTKSVDKEINKTNNPFSAQDPFLKSYVVRPEDNLLFIREDTDIDIPKSNKTNLNLENKDPNEKYNISIRKDEYKKTTTHSQEVTVQSIEHSSKTNENIVTVKIQDSPKKINFEEIARKPKTGFEGEKKSPMPENKPFLRDRSASIGTIKTPIAQLIGEQNRTMLFQVRLYPDVDTGKKKRVLLGQLHPLLPLPYLEDYTEKPVKVVSTFFKVNIGPTNIFLLHAQNFVDMVITIWSSSRDVNFDKQI